MFLLGNFLGAFGFAILFGGNLTESLISGICGILVGLVDRFSDRFKANLMFKNIAASFVMSFAAYTFHHVGLANNVDAVIIGALMILVPGLIFTNAMRDIIYGDTNSGINRIVQVLLVAAAIALGTGTAWSLSNVLGELPVNPPSLSYNWLIQCAASFVGCIGFSLIFNIHGPGMLLCALGGSLSWGVFTFAAHLGCGDLVCYFISAITAASYAEAMARIRKYPAISYLVVSIFPLIPGSGIYYATNHLVLGNMSGFADRGKLTIAIAGVIAVGILIVSTLVRLLNEWKRHKHIKRASV
jgi:uncharacterized membrane protein YjjB (DUF3815 family)